MLAALLSIAVLTVTFTLISMIGEKKKPEMEHETKEKGENRTASKSPSKVMTMEPLPAIGQRSVSLTRQPLVPLNGRKREKNREEENRKSR